VEEPIVAATPEWKEGEVAEVYPEFTPVEEPALGPEFFEPLPELPRTATPFPLLAFAGLAAAGAASVIRFIRS